MRRAVLVSLTVQRDGRVRRAPTIMGLFDFFKKDKENKEQQESLDKGLEKTKTSFFDQLSKAVVGKSSVDEAVLDDLETLLVHADVGIDTTVKVIDRIEKRVARDKYVSTSELDRILREEIAALLEENNSGEATAEFILPANIKPYVIMVVGVNGVGKTTTIGKLAHRFHSAGKKVVLGGDVARGARLPRVLMLSAFKDHLHPIAFLSHLDGVFGIKDCKGTRLFGIGKRVNELIN